MRYRTADKCGWTKISNELFVNTWLKNSLKIFGWYCYKEGKILNETIFTNQYDQFARAKVKSKKCKCNEQDKNFKLIWKETNNNLRSLFTDKVILDNLAGQLNVYYKEEKFVDYQIRVADKTFKVHKIFLSLLSPLFDRLFNSQFKESASLYVLDEDPDRFELFLDYLYGGEDFLQLAPEIQLGMIEIALRLEINLDLVERWIYIWNFFLSFNLPFDLSFNLSFNQAVWEKYREIILSLSNNYSPYILAEKIFKLEFPPNYNWDTNLPDSYNEIKDNINNYLVWRQERFNRKNKTWKKQGWDPTSKSWIYSSS